ARRRRGEAGQIFIIGTSLAVEETRAGARATASGASRTTRTAMGKPSDSREGATRNADWSRIMIERFPLEDLTPDERRIRAKWACRLGLAYGAALLALIAFVA